jgi:iron complex transport system ATP-binding protein
LLADEMVVMAAGQVVHHGACQAPETHAALEAVFDHRIRICQVEDLWMALPR